MNRSVTFQVQKLFLITLVLKVGSSFLGWLFQLQWSLGFAVPLAIMMTYILTGYFHRAPGVSDEKFADSCYYLGFIFTITSIIFSLFDLPNIGTKIQEIAVRFGAAMVSTVLGLGVRVYLVSFKKDIGDAIRDAEDAVLDTTRKFTEQLAIVLEKLGHFESQVDEAARASVERVNRQIENLSKNYAEKLTDFFGDLTTRNQEAFTNALAEVKTSSVRLSDSVDGYSMAMRQNLSSIEAKVGTFADAVTERLRTTTFPDDYFAKHLEAPLTQLKTSATGLADGVRKVSDDVGESSVLLTRVLKRIRDKGDATEASLETVLKLTAQQQAVLDTATGQVTALAQLSSAIEKVDSSLTGTIGAVTNSSEVTAELVGRVSAVVAETEAARKQLQATMSDVIGRLEANAAAVNTLAEKWEIGVKDGVAAARTMAERFDASIGVAETVAEQLGANATASELVASKLDGVAAADARVSGSVAELSHRTAEALGRFDGAVSGLQSMVHRLTELDSAMRAQGSHLKLVADEIKNMKIVVTLPVAEAIGAAIADEKLVPQEVEIANPMVGTSSMAGA